MSSSGAIPPSGSNNPITNSGTSTYRPNSSNAPGPASSNVGATTPGYGAVLATQSIESKAIDKQAELLETKFRTFVENQFAANPELQKWNTPKHREMSIDAVQNFKTALVEFYERELKPHGFSEMLGIGTTGVVFKTRLNNQDYAMKAFITKTDDKGWGADYNLPFNQCQEINKLNAIKERLLSALPANERKGRFDFIQSKASLRGNDSILVYDYMEGRPIIQGEIHHKPWTTWTVNQEYLDNRISTQWISDFLHFMVEAERQGVNMTDYGHLHQTLYRADKEGGKVLLLDPFGSNKFKDLIADDPRDRDPGTKIRMEKQSQNPLVYPLSCLMSSICFLEWAQPQNKPGAPETKHAWRSTVLKHLGNDENKLDSIYNRNVEDLASGIHLAIDVDAEHFPGHDKIFTLDNIRAAYQIIREGAKFGDETAKTLSREYCLKPLTEKGLLLLNRFKTAKS